MIQTLADFGLLHWTDCTASYGVAWFGRWSDMWRSIGIACERSTWDVMFHWSRPMSTL